MIDLLWFALVALLKAFGIVLLGYFFYYRVIDYAHAFWFYGRQGDAVAAICPGAIPILGNLVQVVQSLLKSAREGDNYFVMKHVFDSAMPPESFATAIFFITNGAGLSISDPQVIQELYTTKNKYFDKHPLIKDISICLTGESILFAETTQDWKDTRKALSPAFYKGKLENLTEIAKTAVTTTVNRFEKVLSEQEAEGSSRAEVDIMLEVNTMTTRILLVCAFGVDIADEEVDYWVNGRLEKRTVGFSLASTFHNLIQRVGAPHVQLFPLLAGCFITQSERDLKRNSQALRDFCSKIIDGRREAIRKNPDLAKKGDFLTICLSDEHFKGRDIRVLDECLTFFFAGSQTSSNATQNLIYALCKHPEYQDKILAELDEQIVQPHFKELIEQSSLERGAEIASLDVLELINYENNSDLQLYTQCFNESLRMSPPVYYSSTVRMSENVKAGKLSIRKGDPITINMGRLQNHPKEWQQPEKFIPERFDLKSPYYLTPSGQRRNTYSFSPFLGGQRICIGKTFVEVVSKLTVPTLLTHYKFAFKDGVDRDSVPYMHNHMIVTEAPKFSALISHRNLVHTAK